MDTLAGNTALPRWVLRMGTMISAASSTERLPAPVPIGGTVRLVNSHSCACCRDERHARARHRLGIALDDRVDDELGGQVASSCGHHRRSHRELLVYLQPARELR